MQSKQCELDPIPTKFFQALLPETIKIITKIVNTSLELGQFCQHWKVALVRPLIKKIGLELISSNYRPVSNLPFISKIDMYHMRLCCTYWPKDLVLTTIP